MPTVILRANESQESLLKRYRRKVQRSGLKTELRKRRFFVSKNEQERIEKKKSIRRIKRKQQKRSYR